MAGTNRYREIQRRYNITASSYSGRNDVCVFICHKSEDKPAARDISNYLKNDVGVDVYIDEDNEALQVAARLGDSQRIVDYIREGIEVSTHLLAVISEKSKRSWWVPYEIGVAEEQELEIAHVILRDVGSIPAFLEITEIIETEPGLRNWVSDTMPGIVREHGYQLPRPHIRRL